MKRFYEAFIPTIVSYDADGQAMARGMIFRLLDVITRAEVLNCYAEIPQLAGGLGDMWKKLTNQEILEYFEVKAIDPMLFVNNEELLHAYKTFHWPEEDDRASGNAPALESVHDIMEQLEHSHGFGSMKKAAVLMEADVSWNEVIKNGDDLQAHGEPPEPDPTQEELLDYLESKGISIQKQWPPSGTKQVAQLLALWKYYNAKCLEFAGTDDYHGLLRGRGFIGGIYRGKNKKGIFQLPNDNGMVQGAFNSFWKKEAYNLASDGIQNSIVHRAMKSGISLTPLKLWSLFLLKTWAPMAHG